MEICSFDTLIFDIEVLPHWWCVVYYKDDNLYVITSETYHCAQLLSDLRNKRLLVGFNIKRYDLRILNAIINGCSPERIYKVSQSIIYDDYDYYNSYNFWNQFNFLDLYDDWRFGSLKEFESNYGMDIRESSIPFDKEDLSIEDKKELVEYCKHDVMATYELFKYRKSYIDAKVTLSKLFNIPFFTAMKSTNAKLDAIILKAQGKPLHSPVEFKIPERIEPYIRENVPADLLEMFKELNDEQKEYELFDNKIIYGIGGIHSTLDELIYVESDDNYELINVDVQSYYPNLLIHFNLISRNSAEPNIYADIYNMRLKAKTEAREELKNNGQTEYYQQCIDESNALKLVLNTAYGAMKNEYNALYDYYNASSMCYLGQLALTALANKLYNNIPTLKVIQTNTDGILVKCPKKFKDALCEYVKEWETITELSMEMDYVDTFFQRNVNNYIELTGEEKKPYKLKGKWSNQAFKNDVANLNAPITHMAILMYYTENIPVEKTIRECTNLIDFCFTTKTGYTYQKTFWYYNGKAEEVNKVNRVIATTDRRCGTIKKYKRIEKPDGNIVEQYDKASEIPENCKIVNESVDAMQIPNDIDYDWYIEFAKKKIEDLRNE